MLCGHKTRTTPRRDERGEYERCLACGGRLAWAFGGPEVKPPRRTQQRSAAVPAAPLAGQRPALPSVLRMAGQEQAQ